MAYFLQYSNFHTISKLVKLKKLDFFGLSWKHCATCTLAAISAFVRLASAAAYFSEIVQAYWLGISPNLWSKMISFFCFLLSLKNKSTRSFFHTKLFTVVWKIDNFTWNWFLWVWNLQKSVILPPLDFCIGILFLTNVISFTITNYESLKIVKLQFWILCGYAKIDFT